MATIIGERERGEFRRSETTSLLEKGLRMAWRLGRGLDLPNGSGTAVNYDTFCRID